MRWKDCWIVIKLSVFKELLATSSTGADPLPCQENRSSATSSDLQCVLQECSEKRMHGSMFPTSPFVCHYDDKYDIKRRASRLKRKVAGTVYFGRSLLPFSSLKYFLLCLLLLEMLWDYFHVLGKAMGI